MTIRNESEKASGLEATPRGKATHATRRGRRFAIAILLSALFFLIVGSVPGLSEIKFSTNNYLIFHISVELLSVVISSAIFMVGWYGYRQNQNKQDLVIGVVFLAVGLTDFLHTLSYKGMPQFLTPNSVSKASTYWIVARLINSAGLLAAAFVSPGSTRRWVRSSVLATASVLLVVVIAAVITYHPEKLPAMYVPGVGQTPTKVALEWVVIFLYTAALYVFGARSHGHNEVELLQIALMLSIFGELSFTLYRSAFDTYNLLGHLYKLAAYLLIFRALFVSAFERPYRELLRAREQIKHSFSSIGHALASSLELEKTLELIAQLAADMFGTRHAAVMMVHDGQLQLKACVGMTPASTDVSREHTSAGFALAAKEAISIKDVTQINGHDPHCHCQRLDGSKARSVVSAPIISGRRVLGIVEVYSTHPGAFGSEEESLLSTFASQAATAIQNSMTYEQERNVAKILQKNLLPEPPLVPDLDTAVQYVPAENIATVGGDLYDIFALDDRRLVLVIGDVCGHGLEAGSIMAMVVYTIKALLIHGMSPGEALRYANLTLCHRGGADGLPTFATVFVSILDIETRDLTYANAGHHMPVILRRGGSHIMEIQSDLPIGVEETLEFTDHAANLAHAEGILLYTDGVVESRRSAEQFGDRRLCALCDELLDRSANELLDRVVEGARGWAGILQDDVALVAVKWDSRR